MATEKDRMQAVALAAAYRFGDRRIVNTRYVERWFEQYWDNLTNPRPSKGIVTSFESKPRIRKI